MNQEFVTIALPFAAKSEWNPLREADVVRMLDGLGNPACQAIREKLDRTGIVHFISINVVGAQPDDARAFLLIEATVDGSAEDGVVALDAAIGDDLFPVVALACGLRQRGALRALMLRHSREMTRNPLRLPGKVSGLGFLGTPGISVPVIRKNRQIAEFSRERIHALRSADPAIGPQSTVREVRKAIAQVAELETELCSPQPPLSFVETANAPWLKHLRDPSGSVSGFFGASVQWLLLLLAGPLLFAFLFAAKTEGEQLSPGYSWIIHAAMVAIFPAILFVAMEIGLVLLLLRSAEKANRPQDIDPDPATLAAAMSRENHPSSSQNHMISITTRLPGPLRRVTLLFAFYGIALAARLGLMRSGFLANIGTIHSARWVVMPGTRKLVFVSNYDGSWESYLEDFITKASEGVTGVWSNAIGFPRTRLLFLDGAKDGDRMKRFARRSMKPTAFWYSAYPTLTCEQIRKQAIIVSGLRSAGALADSPLDAEAWLDQFSTIPRPEYGLEYDEIQALMFGGLKRHPYGHCLLVGFGEPRGGDAECHPYQHVQAWLNELYNGRWDRKSQQFDRRGTVDFGSRLLNEVVVNIAFSASGLRKLGLDRELDYSGARFAPGAADPKGFPLAFAMGMNHPSRKRILADPENLDWTDSTADAALLLYAKEKDTAGAEAEYAGRRIARYGMEVRAKVDSALKPFDNDGFKQKWFQAAGYGAKPSAAAPAPTPAPGTSDFSEEPFGFVDGVSQPRIRGFPGTDGGSKSIHDVEPGEFILGYADNRGYYPPSPQLAPQPGHIGMQALKVLPCSADCQPQRYPDFENSLAMSDGTRDFGRNGSYLVIRQLEQDVDGFDRQLDELMSQVINKYPLRQKACVDAIDPLNPYAGNPARTREWIAAKMVGRWRNGSSLVANPLGPAFDKDVESQADNGFLFKDVDPQGLRCPLGSHIRRSFPRDSLSPEESVELSVANRHRLLRRGRPYLDDGGKPAGTLFMCFNADIERQFEFVQQTWVGSPSFHGLDGETDPFVTHKCPMAANGNQGGILTIQGPAAPLTLEPIQRLVTLKGGGYFFLPGRHALWFLAGAALIGDDAMMD